MDYLHDLGSSALLRFWLPVGLWTLLAPLSLLLAGRMSRHPRLQLTFRYAVLTSLPAGILLLNLIPQAPSMLLATPLHDWLIVVNGPDVVRVDAVLADAPSWTWQAMLGLLTIGVMISAMIGLIRHAANHFALRSYRNHALKPASEPLQSLASTVASDMGIRQPFRLMTTALGTVPHTFGWRRAVIVLPDEQRDELTNRLILTHELNHVRRGDFAAQYAEQVIKAMFLFHPLVHRIVHELHLFRELACDADVVGFRPDLIKSYASLLLDFSGTPAQPKLTVVLSMATSSKHIQERIRTMKKIHPNPTRFSVFAPIGVFILLSGFLTMSRTSTQPPPPPPPDAPVPDVFIVVEQMPEPIGGMKAIYDAIVYPEIAKKAGIEGRVVLQFTVDEQGNVTEPRVIRGIGGGCDEAALNAIKDLKFIPGMQRGRAVKVQLQLPIVFRLPSEPTDAANESYSGTSVTINRIASDNGRLVIRGRVADSITKDALSGANIMVQAKDGSQRRGASTGPDGTFIVGIDEPGEYNIRVSYVGYATPEFGVRMARDESYSVDVAMSKTVIHLNEIERN